MYARLAAIMQEYNVSPDDLLDENGRPMLFLDSGRGRGNRLTLVERKDGFLRPTAQLDHVIKTAVHEGFGLTMLDPLVSLHQASENVNEEMRAVFDHLADIAQDGNCAVHAMSHTGKPDKKSSDGFAGDAYAARGASAQPDAARVASTFMSMSKEDLKRWATPGGGSHLEYARLDVAKINDGPKPSAPQWYWRKQIIVPGYRGGRLPVLQPIDLEPIGDDASAEDMAAQVAEAIRQHHAVETWLPIADLLARLPARLAAALGGENRARKLDQIFASKEEVTVEGIGTLKRTTARGRAGTKLWLSVIPHSSNASNPVDE
jgi:AAA domain-containing protein